MKKGVLTVVLIIDFLFFLIPAAGLAGTKLKILIGQSKTIRVDGVKRVAVGNPDIADFSVISSGEVRVVAKSKGITTLEIWDKNDKVLEYNLEVLSVDTGELMQKIKTLLGKDIMRLVTMKPVEGDRIVLEGEYDTQEDMKRMQEVLRAFGDQVINFLKPSKILRETSTYKISEIINIDTVDVKLVNNTILLDGIVPTKEDRERARDIAKMFNKKVVNALKIGSNQLVQVDVKIYEMNAEFTADIDINLLSPAEFTSDTDYTYKLFKKPSGGIFTSYLHIDNKLNAAIGQGRGKLLAKPKLVTVNGGKATFKSGGERGYHVLSSQGVPSIEWKRYGIELEIEPLISEINGEKNIRLHVKALLSELEDLRTAISVAALITSNADVNVYMKPEETLLIAGLLKNKKTKKVSRFPILGYIPIIDLLFKSVKEEIVEKELLMFITPRIVSARGITSEIMDIKKKQDFDYEKLEGTRGKNKEF